MKSVKEWIIKNPARVIGATGSIMMGIGAAIALGSFGCGLVTIGLSIMFAAAIVGME